MSFCSHPVTSSRDSSQAAHSRVPKVAKAARGEGASRPRLAGVGFFPLVTAPPHPDVEAPGARGAFSFRPVAVGPCAWPHLPRRDHGTLPLLRDGHPPQAEGAWAPPRRQGPHGVSRAQWPESARRAGRRRKGVGERAASPGARAVSRCLGAGDAESRGAGGRPPGAVRPQPQPCGHSLIREACSWQRGSQCPQSPRGTVAPAADITSHLQHPPFRAE